MEKLPYVFDLTYDIKTMEDVELIASGEPHCSSASPDDLVNMFIALKMEVPKCLDGETGTQEIWVCKDGTWLPYKPLPDEIENYRKAKMSRFDR